MTGSRPDRAASPALRPRRPLPLSAALVIALAALSCGGGDGESLGRRGGSSALWVAGQPSPEVSPALLSTLRAVGIEELWLESARLDAGASGITVERLAPVALPPRSAVTLVVTGHWPAVEIAIGDAVESAANFLRQLSLDVETRGLEVTGFHLEVDLEDAARLEDYGRFVGRLRKRLRRQGRVSAGVEPAWIDRQKDVRPLLDGVDLAVVPLYGNPLEAADRRELWSLERVIEGAQHLEEKRVPFLVEVSLQGRAQRFDAAGNVTEELAGLHVADLLASELSVEPLFDFSGGLRQEIEAVATARPQIGTLTLAPRERLRVLRPTAYDLDRLEGRLREQALEHYRGLLLRRWPRAGETLTLPPEQVALALGEAALEPELRLSVDRLASDRFRVSVENLGPVPTAVAVVNHNYVEVKLERARLGSVDVGDFKRQELENSQRAEGDMRALRHADVLRLFYPGLEPGASISSGTIRIHGTGGTPAVAVGARFFLPGGRTLELPLRDSRELDAANRGETAGVEG